ncbi:acyltransferase [Pseudomonas sp. 21LCFQ02]|uniref:acyltransferase family protein n=1 Tax=Pseudomonas sp. 21LCFQ02 TaxID=2957505 RepID=UPI00209ABE2D|nr:acyltransferase family protein [Pseudomonas sp. 21LCFQ02]MCO8168840.1 acyltransferase [Pseudomonas sp. 21LCFQ02]
MTFRKDINGLRAIAVLGVLLYHFHPAWLPGGFAGVDVFFVISGYLITGIVLRGLGNQSFSLVQFYRSRAQRIIPALAVLCLVLLGGGWFYLLPLDYAALGKHVAASLGFVSNIVYWREAGYFTADAHEKWLLHTWSLSVEWQFYLLYPVVLLLLKRLVGLNALRGWIVAGCLASFALCLAASRYWPEPAFYLLPTRAWELLLGAVACVFPVKLKPAQQRWLEGLGLGLILFSFAFIKVQQTWSGYLVLLPVLGTWAMIAAARQDSPVTGNPLAQWLGSLSYSLYLWHWPVVVVMNYAGWLGDTRNVMLGMSAALLLGMASYRLVEKPGGNSRPAPVRKLTALSTLITLVFVGGVTVSLSEGVVLQARSISTSDKARFIQRYVDKQNNLYEPYWLKCDAFSAFTQRGQTQIDASCTRRQGEGGVLLWGDSHAQALSLGLRTLLPAGTPFYQVTSASCPARFTAIDRRGASGRACDYATRLAWDSVEQLRPDVVVMAQKDNHDQTAWNALAARLRDYGVKHIVLVGPVPQWSPSLPSVIANRHWEQREPYINDPALNRHLMAVDQATRHLIDPTSIRFVSLIEQLCNRQGCLARLGGNDELLQIDDGHLSAEGSLYVVRHYVLPQL